MDATWGHEYAHELLVSLSEWLTVEHSDHRFHLDLARSVGQLARIGGFDTLANAAANLLRLAPEAAFVAGVISNIDDLSGLVRRDPPTLDEAESFFPTYSTDRVQKVLTSVAEPHVRKLLLGDIEGALEAADNDLAKEEYASTCAVLGHIDHCLNAIKQPTFPQQRALGPLMTSCVECFRADRRHQTEELLRALFERWPNAPWVKVHVSAGLLGRVPWPGYPYPDY